MEKIKGRWVHIGQSECIYLEEWKISEAWAHKMENSRVYKRVEVESGSVGISSWGKSISRFSLLGLYHMGYVKWAKLALWSRDMKKISRSHPKIELYGESPNLGANARLRQAAIS